MRGATKPITKLNVSQANFNPRAPCGARPSFITPIPNTTEFQPTRPLRGATVRTNNQKHHGEISTHAPLAGRDGDILRRCLRSRNFNPRAPCGARLACLALIPFGERFQPTRPLRGATSAPAWRCSPHSHFNPRAPCGARQVVQHSLCDNVLISTHAPLAGRDDVRLADTSNTYISTHAPLAGRDLISQMLLQCRLNFNPRAPCGARPSRFTSLSSKLNFNPRAPCGARPSTGLQVVANDDFNPRAPCGARPRQWKHCCITTNFNPRAPCGARRRYYRSQEQRLQDFNPRAPCGARLRAFSG